MKKTNSYKVVDNIVYVKFNNVDEEFICDLEDWGKLKEIKAMLIKSINTAKSKCDD